MNSVFVACLVHFLVAGSDNVRIVTGELLEEYPDVMIVDVSHSAEAYGLKGDDYKRYVARPLDCSRSKGTLQKRITDLQEVFGAIEEYARLTPAELHHD